MTKSLEEEINHIVAKMDDQQNQQTPQDQEKIQDVYVLIVREHEDVADDQSNIVESQSAPATTQRQNISFLPAYVICSLYIFLIFSTIAFQLYLLFNPPIVTITIIPKSQQETLNGTLPLGRFLQPITISQSQTVPTTGHGHQDAKQATGTVTFFNGLFMQQFIASGSVYTGQDGVAIVTTQDAVIPAGDPSSGYGTLTVTAQALQAGSKGNIQVGDINITINNGLLVRNNTFHNGQDERTYNTVTQHDLHSVSTVMKSSLDRSMQGALAASAKTNETIVPLPCSPTISPNHLVGDEAIQVKVTVSETCGAVAYDTQAFTMRAMRLLTSHAYKNLTGYSLFGKIQVSVKQATINHTTNQVFLSFRAAGTWVYGLSSKSQQHIKELLTGKSKDQALSMLMQMPGIERASISWGDDTKLPKNSTYLHIILLVL